MFNAWSDNNVLSKRTCLNVAILLVLSFIIWSLFVLYIPKNRYKTLRMPNAEQIPGGGYFTDHTSHFMSTVLFAYKGYSVYHKPLTSLAEQQSDEDAGRAGIATYQIAGRLNKRGLEMNWSVVPRAYPPGLFLYSSVEALLFEFTSTPIENINKISLIKYLFVAHILLLALILLFLSGLPHGITIVLVFFLYIQIIWWTLSGFYDCFAVLFVVLSLQQIFVRQNPWLSILFYSIALFCSFRAIWYLPVLLFVAVAFLSPDRRREFWKHKNLILSILSVILFGLSLYAFYCLSPSLADFTGTNIFHYTNLIVNRYSSFTCWGLPLMVLLAGLLFERAWKVAIIVLWQAVVLSCTYQLQPWHSLFLIPIIPAAYMATKDPMRRTGVVCIAFLIYILNTAVVYNSSILPEPFLKIILQEF